MPQLGAVILTYGPADRHGPLLEDLQDQGLGPQRIVVVHNPRCPSGDHVPLAPAGAAVLAMERNVGYGPAMNRGLVELRRRGADVGLLLTHDTRLEPGALEALVSAAEEHPRHGVLGLVVEYGSSEYGRFVGARFKRGRVVHHQEASGPTVEADWVEGSAMAVRLTAFEDAGPLPEEYFMYFEEAVLGSRMRAHGWGVAVVSAARARSAPGGAARRGAYGYLYSRNGLDWARRYCGAAAATRFVLARLSSAAQVVMSAIRRRRPELFTEVAGSLLGLVDGLRGRLGPPPARLMRASDIDGT